MNDDLRNLYRVLGYDASSSLEEAPDVARKAAFTVAAGPPGGLPLSSVAREVPPLDPEGAEELTALFEQDPERVTGKFQRLWSRSITQQQVGEAINRARGMLTQPAHGVAAFRAARALDDAASKLPPEFTFDGMDLDAYPIDPGNTQFETTADAARWVIMTGALLMHSTFARLAPFRGHDEPRFPSRFIYSLDEPTPSSPVDLALLADFGTGLYHSRYIARQLQRNAFPYAIHLGDVYYAGRESEFNAYFARELDPILTKTGLFTLAGNHERYSLMTPFFKYMDRRRSAHPGLQKQEGSYFCLRSSRFQIVAIDTQYYGSFRYKNARLLGWAESVLDEGRRNGLINILLSADEPYEYGSKATTGLFDDLRHILVDRKLVDLWFWGNTHYCALFGATDSFPFIGSCIGHGGYPYDKERRGKPSPAPVLFLETQGRFPEWTRLRPDRGNNGYCILRLAADGTIGLRYVDWMSHDRCLVTLGRPTPTGPLAIKSLAVY